MIEVKLIGLPEIINNHTKVVFPFKKAEALFYYLCHSKRINRNKAILMFWVDMPDQMARKSLRNAVYVIKKTLSSDVLITSNREYIELNESVVKCNDDYLMPSEMTNSVFLQDFYVKDAEGFEIWLNHMRQQVREQSMESLKERILSHLKSEEFAQADKLCKVLIQCDEYNEEAYRIHMEVCRQMGEHGRCIEIFSCISRILESELSLKPDVQTLALFESIMKERTKKTETRVNDNHFFFGRVNELQYLLDTMNQFLNDIKTRSIWIDGEMGIGKTYLINSFLETISNYDSCVLKSSENCNDKGHSLSAWVKPVQVLHDEIMRHHVAIDEIDRLALGSVFPIFEDHQGKPVNHTLNKRLDVNNYRVVASAIANAVIRLSHVKKVLIVLDGVHHFDEMSFSVIKEILYKDHNKNILIFVTIDSTIDKKYNTLMTELKCKNLISVLNLKRFSQEESYGFMKKFKHSKDIDDMRLQWVFQESDGNPLFMTELLKTAHDQQEIPTKMKDVFRYKILSLSEKGQKLLDIAAAFRASFSFDALLKISGMNDFQLLSIVDELIEKDVLKESCCDTQRDWFQFVHHKLKDFVYESQYKAKQKLIHKKIAEYYEYQPMINYDELLYHYRHAGDKHNFLKFKIQTIFDYLEMAHEMFPIVKNGKIVTELLSQRGFKSDLKIALEEINHLYQELLSKDNDISVELEIYHLNLMSRYYIIYGKGERGVQLIEKMIQLATASDDITYILKGYKLLVYHYINTHQINDMGMIVNLAIKLAHKHGFKEELGVFIRFKGMYYIFSGDLIRGDNYLNAALKFFNSFDDTLPFTLNIMACYYYMGESKRTQKCYSEAITFYQQAILIAERFGYVDRLTLFYSCLGQLYFDMRQFDDAEHFLQKAIHLYEQFDFQWGRVLAWGYLALLSCYKNELSSALYCLEKADQFQQVLNNHLDFNKLSFIRKEVMERSALFPA